MSITQGYVSKTLVFFKKNFMKKYKLVEYVNIHKPCVFYGCYNKTDLETIKKNKSLKIIIFGGTDTYYKKYEKARNMLNKIKTIPNTFFISQSSFISSDLNAFNIIHSFVPIAPTVNLKCNPQVKGLNIYVYTNPLNEPVYGSNFYYRLMNEFKDINFILACAKKTSETKKIKCYAKDALIKVYSSCFLGLRLVQHDGISATMQEMGLLGIKTISNGISPACINYTNYDSIVNIINEERKKIGTLDNETSQKTYDYLNINDEWLNIKNYKNINKPNTVNKLNITNKQKNTNKLNITTSSGTKNVKTFKLYGRTFKYSKCGKINVWDAIINKKNIIFYRIYKMVDQWVLYIKQKYKKNIILYHNNNINNDVPPLFNWEKTIKTTIKK